MRAKNCLERNFRHVVSEFCLKTNERSLSSFCLGEPKKNFRNWKQFIVFFFESRAPFLCTSKIRPNVDDISSLFGFQ